MDEEQKGGEEQLPPRNTFQLIWGSFFGGLFLHIFAVAFFLLVARTYRRDKIYSSLLGAACNLLVSWLLIRYGVIQMYY